MSRRGGARFESFWEGEPRSAVRAEEGFSIAAVIGIETRVAEGPMT